MANGAKVNGIAIGVIGFGGLLCYSGIKGYSVTQAIAGIIQGKSPASLTNINAIGTPTGVSSSGGGTSPGGSAPTATGSAIANDALRYKGARYVFGGAPANGIGIWDCSSFVSWVLGHDLHMSVPGYPNGSYTGTVHGPTAAEYKTWSGAHDIARSQAQAGDLCCWDTHIGIAISNSQMISAYDTASGTIITSIDGGGPSGETLQMRQIG